jgi:hypothetical protein
LYYFDDEKTIYKVFDINEFKQLDLALHNMAPSLCEYYLDDLITNLSPYETFNRSNIQDCVYMDVYTIYLDYNDKIFIEFKKNDDYETNSLW